MFQVPQGDLHLLWVLRLRVDHSALGIMLAGPIGATSVTRTKPCLVTIAVSLAMSPDTVKPGNLYPGLL